MTGHSEQDRFLLAILRYVGAHDLLCPEVDWGRHCDDGSWCWMVDWFERGEVVHHIDANRQNNHPSNLAVFPDQATHARCHAGGVSDVELSGYRLV